MRHLSNWLEVRMFSIRRHRFRIGFICLTLVMLLVTFAAFKIPLQQRSEQAWVTHTHDVLDELASLSKNFSELEAYQRTYLITGNFLDSERYSETMTGIDKRIARLQSLTKDNFSQQAHIGALIATLEAKRNGFDRIAQFHLPKSALKGYDRDRNLVSTDVFQRQVQVMRGEEMGLREARIKRWQDTMTVTKWALLGGAMLLYGIISVLYLALRNEGRYRERLLKIEQDDSRAQRENARRLAEIVAVQHEIASHRLQLDEVMRIITSRTQTLTRATGSIIEMQESEEMVYRMASGSAAAFSGMRIPAKGSLSGLCVAKGEVLKCDDSETDTRVDQNACRKVGLRSMVVVPLRHNNKAVGVLKSAVTGAARVYRTGYQPT